MLGISTRLTVPRGRRGSVRWAACVLLVGAAFSVSVSAAGGAAIRRGGSAGPRHVSMSRFANVVGVSDSRMVGDAPMADAFSDPKLQRVMLALARKAFDQYARNRTVIDAPAGLPFLLTRARCGVFVSTMRYGAPRTCMGTLYPAQADLADEIIENAVASAGRDLRFKPVQPGELSQLDLIVSVITEAPRPISAEAAARLDPAREGLAVQRGDRFGVVLSGETPHPADMLAWGKIRAGIKPGQDQPAQYYAVDDVRFMESQFKP